MKSGRGIVVGLKHVVVLAVVVCGASLAFGGPSIFTDYASFDVASNTVLTEDFENLAIAYDTALSSFTSNGITYAGVGGRNVWVASPGYTNFGVNPTTTSILTATGDEDFTAELSFGSAVTALGFDTYLNEYGPATIEVWSGTTLLDTVTYSHDPTTIGFFGVTAAEGITKIRWTTIEGKTINTGIDNVLTGVAVPAPGALMLGSLGVGLVGWLRRRRTM